MKTFCHGFLLLGYLLAPSQGHPGPSDGLLVPSKGLLAPSQGLLAPSQELLAPSQGLLAPSQGLLAPSQGLLAPSQGLLAPSQELKPGDDVVIDGRETTIGLATTYYFRSLMATSDIFLKIINILLPASEDVDYFEVIKEDVQTVVGDYIDQHNMDQLQVYKSDLGVLLQRYYESPVESSTYPDKNTVANSLSTSIVANRYLVEAGERPQSMIIHYADIASIHILALQDVAETYSNNGVISMWWVDLNDQLGHYIDHGRRLQDDVVDWRNDMMMCDYNEGKKYDTWTVTDQVTGVVDTCTQVHGTHACDDHCQAYQISMNREVSLFVWNYLGKSIRQWELLKVKAAHLANKVDRMMEP